MLSDKDLSVPNFLKLDTSGALIPNESTQPMGGFSFKDFYQTWSIQKPRNYNVAGIGGVIVNVEDINEMQEKIFFCHGCQANLNVL